MKNRFHHLFSVICVATVALVILAGCPWSRWTGGRLKDIDLFAEFMNRPREVSDDNYATESGTDVDPELQALTLAADSVASKAEEHVDTLPPVPHDFTAPRLGETVLLEDYSADGTGLVSLRDLFGKARNRNVRIAMVGDSYIEGDILAQDIRAGLQDRYGGAGVGYVGAFSRFPGFRGSVNQVASGWDEKEIKDMKHDSLRTILGHYHIARNGAETKFTGSAKPDHTDRWERTRILFMAPANGTITFSGADNMTDIRDVEASSRIQQLTTDASTASIKISTTVPGLKVLGIWLENPTGIVLDDISLRGNSGLSHRSLNAAATEAMRRWVDYDLIILEFGLNVVSNEQKNYSVYGRSMTEVVDNLKGLYPNARFLIMGVGDRATKINGELKSMPTLNALIREQREVARRTGSLFFDTREAMGGPGAAIDWHREKLVNSDYVHLNHKGGRRLAEIILESIDKSLQ